MQDIHKELAEAYLESLTGRDIPHRRACIIFSGVPGSGKTTLTKRLSHDLQAQYIRHDDIRQLARERGLDVASLTISSVSRIVMDVISENDANGRIVLDSSLDRTWDLFFDYVKQRQVLPIVIRLNVPREVVEARVEARDADDFGKVSDLDIFFEQFEASKKHVTADIELSENYDYSDVLRRVMKLLQ
jgi:predicted kinase